MHEKHVIDNGYDTNDYHYYRCLLYDADGIGTERPQGAEQAVY